jgi:hypothetical protein
MRALNVLLALCAALLLGACAIDSNIEAVSRVCAATTRTLADEVDCTKRRLEADNWRRSPAANDIATYLGYADAVVERVRAGRQSEADARQDLRQMRQRLRGELRSTDQSRPPAKAG